MREQKTAVGKKEPEENEENSGKRSREKRAGDKLRINGEQVDGITGAIFGNSVYLNNFT